MPFIGKMVVHYATSCNKVCGTVEKIEEEDLPFALLQCYTITKIRPSRNLLSFYAVSTQFTNVLCVSCLFVVHVLVISHFDFEDRIFVLVPVPGHCL